MVERTLVGGGDLYMLIEMTWTDAETRRTALRSPENAAVGADLANFATGLVTVLTGSSD